VNLVRRVKLAKIAENWDHNIGPWPPYSKYRIVDVLHKQH
jgi:hypothetical protein